MSDIYWPSFFFLLFAGLVSFFALAVVFTANIVRMAFFLTLALGSTAGLFFLAGADFVGAMQLMICVGGTLVLLVFGVMLTAQAPFVSMKTPPAQIGFALLLGGLLFATLAQSAFGVAAWRPMSREAADKIRSEKTATRLGMALVNVRTDSLEAKKSHLPDATMNVDSNPVEAASPAGYLFPFEAVAFHLLIVLIGAAYLARLTRHRAPSSDTKRSRSMENT